MRIVLRQSEQGIAIVIVMVSIFILAALAGGFAGTTVPAGVTGVLWKYEQPVTARAAKRIRVRVIYAYSPSSVR